MSQWAEATTIGDLLVRSAAKRPDHDAIVFPRARFTYREVADHAVHAARSLAALGVGRGDHVGLLMPNCPDFVFNFFGIQLLGAVAVPINTRFRARELSFVVANADLVVLLTSDIVDDQVDFVERLAETFGDLPSAADPVALELADAPRLRSIVLLGEKAPPGFLPQAAYDRMAERVDESHVLRERAAVRVRDVGLMLFTSGTTANPKGCQLTHESVVRVWCTAAWKLRITSEDRVWDALPLFHMSCIGPMLFCFDLGATLISMLHFEPGAALEQIETERATWLYTVFPPITMALIRHADMESRDLTSVRGLLNVAPPDTLRLMQDAFRPAVQVGGHFGMTECGGAITCNAWDASEQHQAETCGPPLPGVEVRVTDPESGVELGPYETGELQVRGYGVFEGYYRQPELTAAMFDPDGWLRSGDQGRMDEAGRVSYLGRLKDMLKVGGENVAPSEIESHISTHPAVKLVQVVGAPDERLEEVPAAFIELVPGRQLSAADAVEYCRGQIASFKVPRYVRFVSADDWPMSATKIQKFRLQERIAKELGEASGAVRTAS